LPITEIFWRYTPGFKFVQFPWRFQPFVALGCGLLAATACEIWPTLNPKLRLITSAVLTWNVIAAAIFTLSLVRLDEPSITRAQIIDIRDAPIANPLTVKERRRLIKKKDTNQISYAANEFSYPPRGSNFIISPPATQPGGLSIVSGRGRVVSQE